MAGSFGYVAPEILNHKGHGKPVDLWSIGYCSSPTFSDSRRSEMLISLSQSHHLHAPLRIHALPVRRHEGARTTDDGGKG